MNVLRKTLSQELKAYKHHLVESDAIDYILTAVTKWGDESCNVISHYTVDAPRYFVVRAVPKRRECSECWRSLRQGEGK